MSEDKMLTPDDRMRIFTSEKRKLTMDELFEDEMYELDNIEIILTPCEICGYTNMIRNQASIQQHHIDTNHKNNNPSNLMVLCANCHIELHHLLKKEYFSKWSRASSEEKLQICKEAKNQLRNEKISQNRVWVKK